MLNALLLNALLLNTLVLKLAELEIKASEVIYVRDYNTHSGSWRKNLPELDLPTDSKGKVGKSPPALPTKKKDLAVALSFFLSDFSPHICIDKVSNCQYIVSNLRMYSPILASETRETGFLQETGFLGLPVGWRETGARNRVSL
ncbi:hypothetical protein AM228_03255 [Planktothricoides sp. SR001]|uniref:hypothetical protein n=1 Tax=Planktothricoides sp. SR001 TaxID=1705388 RepID=UPI0006C6F0F1|nr:hypothetical protein [Planktothricoides sp. SR001]KOR38174.1 hypothetical protein AM228_03255 [Planktothricoides sp. SR001]